MQNTKTITIENQHKDLKARLDGVELELVIEFLFLGKLTAEDEQCRYRGYKAHDRHGISDSWRTVNNVEDALHACISTTKLKYTTVVTLIGLLLHESA